MKEPFGSFLFLYNTYVYNTYTIIHMYNTYNKYILNNMNSLQNYINESISNSETIKTKEIVNILKKEGETTQEIKKDININKNNISYLNCAKIFCTKCIEWSQNFVKIHKQIQQHEGDDYLSRNLGDKWIKYFNESFNNFTKSVVELNKIINTDIKESFYVKDINNYHVFYKHLVLLNEFDDKMIKIENNILHNDNLSEYKNILKLRSNISKNIKKLFKSTEYLKHFLEAVYNYKNNRLN